jgi:hypothetical protein
MVNIEFTKQVLKPIRNKITETISPISAFFRFCLKKSNTKRQIKNVTMLQPVT